MRYKAADVEMQWYGKLDFFKKNSICKASVKGQRASVFWLGAFHSHLAGNCGEQDVEIDGLSDVCTQK